MIQDLYELSYQLKLKTELTKIGSTIGTAAYMSPEQTKGEEVDHRTDIWSFGVVLYEMLNGQLPFKGDYEQAVIYSIINEEPDSVRGDLPNTLKIILQKSLRKNVRDRYEKMKDILEDLKAQQNASTGSESSNSEKQNFGNKFSKAKKIIPALATILVAVILTIWFLSESDALPEGRIPIAVADFENLTGEPELNALSGMLITALEHSHRLSVMTRSRMFDVLRQLGKDDVLTVNEKIGREICQQADVIALAVPTIRKFGNVYSIDLKVLNTKQNRHLFSGHVKDEGQESIPDLIDQIAEQVRIEFRENDQQLKLEPRKVAQVTTPNLSAYQHYFKGKEYTDKLQFDKAKNEFKKAIELDSTFGLAYYSLSYAMGWNAEKLSTEYLDKALKWIDRIPEKEQYLVRAEKLRQGQGFAAGIPMLKEMEKLYPNDKEMLFNLGDWAFHSGDINMAEEYFEKVLALDPDHPRTIYHFDQLFFVKYIKGPGEFDFRESLAKAKEFYKKNPERSDIRSSIITLYAFMGEYENAENEIKQYMITAQTGANTIKGLQILASLLPYTGQYKRTYATMEKIIQQSYAQKDTTTAILTLMNMALVSSLGAEDNVLSLKIFKRINASKGYQNVDHGKHRLTMIAAISGQKAKAFELLESFQSQEIVLLPIIFSAVGESEKASSFVDMVLSISELPNSVKIMNIYLNAKSFYDNGKLDKAEKRALQMLQYYSPPTEFAHNICYPKNILLLGKINETKGNIKNAIRYYEQFLGMWKKADNGLKSVEYAKSHLSKLKGITVK